MHRRLRASLTLAASVAGLFSSVGSATAAPPPDAAGWIRQGGNGASGSEAEFDLGFTEILFRPDMFQVAGTNIKTSDKWRGWGGVVQADGRTVLAMSQGGTDANWSAPQLATLRDPSGADVPFLLGDTVHFAVQFQNVRQNWPAYFIVYWNGGDPSLKGTNANTTPSASSTHIAVSMDGVRWFDDVAVGMTPTDPLITGTTGFNAGALGATQLVLNPRAGLCTDAPTGNFPFDCAISIVYTAVSSTGATSIGLAGADRYDALGSAFRTRPTPVFSPSGAGWDSGSVDLGKMRQRKAPEGSGWELTYGGSTATLGCQTTKVCQIGVASSSNRVSWTRNNVSRAATEPALFEHYLDAPLTLGPAIFVSDGNPSGHARGFISVRSSSVADTGTTWNAVTSPAPTTKPTLEVSKPDNGAYNSSTVAIDLFANDDLGTNPGIDTTSIEISIDGQSLEDLGASWSTGKTIVGSYYVRGERIQAPAAQVVLPDGVHTMTASVADLDGEIATISTTFTVDTTAPESTIATTTTSPNMFTYPFEAPITLTGKTTDMLSGVEAISATVTNTLGTQVTFDSRASGSGFSLTPIANGYSWSFTPPPHPMLFVPGTMQVSILGRDKARNIELRAPRNTRDLIVI